VGHRLVAVADRNGDPSVYSWITGGHYWIQVPGVATYRFQQDAASVTAWPDPGAREDAVIDAYQTSALPMGMHAKLGHEAFHASAILADGGVAAFCGPSEVGKSTTAYGLGLRGYPLWADDAVTFTIGKRQSVASIALPASFKLRSDVDPYLRRASVAKTVKTAPPWTSAPMLSLFLLQRASEPPLRSKVVTIEPMSPADALLAVFANAYRFRPSSRLRERKMMRSYLELVVRVPVYQVTCFPGRRGLEDLLDKIEETLESADRRRNRV
jgi:hypothetical protein